MSGSLSGDLDDGGGGGCTLPFFLTFIFLAYHKDSLFFSSSLSLWRKGKIFNLMSRTRTFCLIFPSPKRGNIGMGPIGVGLMHCLQKREVLSNFYLLRVCVCVFFFFSLGEVYGFSWQLTET